MQGDPFENESKVHWKESNKCTFFNYYVCYTEWVFFVSYDTVNVWLVIHGKSENGRKWTAISKVCAVACKIWDWQWCHVKFLLICLEILLFFVVTQLKLGALNMERWSTLTFVRSWYIPRKQIQYSRYCCNSAITWPSDLQDSLSLISLMWGASEEYYAWSVSHRHWWLEGEDLHNFHADHTRAVERVGFSVWTQ